MNELLSPQATHSNLAGVFFFPKQDHFNSPKWKIVLQCLKERLVSYRFDYILLRHVSIKVPFQALLKWESCALREFVLLSVVCFSPPCGQTLMKTLV